MLAILSMGVALAEEGAPGPVPVEGGVAVEAPTPAGGGTAERVRKKIPWLTVTGLATTDAMYGLDGVPYVGGSLAVLAGPALLLYSEPANATRIPGSFRSEGSRIDAGLSAGFLARVDTPQPGESSFGSRTFGGYFRLGTMDESGREARHTLAAGHRQARLGKDATAADGQLDITLVTEWRVLPAVGIGADLRVLCPSARQAGAVGAGAAVMVGM